MIFSHCHKWVVDGKMEGAGPSRNRHLKRLLDCSERASNAFTHGLHPYPAKMVPQIASYLTNRYSEPGDIILDPFCGSGTTLVEALLNQRNAIGCDINPFAVLLSRVKTTPIDPADLLSVWQILKRSLSTSTAISRAGATALRESSFLNLGFWYKPYVIRDLGYICDLTNSTLADKDSRILDFFRLMIARTARQVSNQRPGEFKRWRISQTEMALYRPKPIDSFIENVENALPKMESYFNSLKKGYKSRVLLKDVRNLKLRKKVSLILTSPPYGDSGTTVAYGEFSSFGSEWIGLADKDTRRLDRYPFGNIVGSKVDPTQSRSLARTYDAVRKVSLNRATYMGQFFDGMSSALQVMRNTLESDGVCCLIIGNRRIRGIEIPTARIIEELACQVGFRLEYRHIRRVSNKVMPYATKPWNASGKDATQPTINSESILVLHSN